MVKRSDFRPTNNKINTISDKDRKLIQENNKLKEENKKLSIKEQDFGVTDDEISHDNFNKNATTTRYINFLHKIPDMKANPNDTDKHYVVIYEKHGIHPAGKYRFATSKEQKKFFIANAKAGRFSGVSKVE